MPVTLPSSELDIQMSEQDPLLQDHDSGNKLQQGGCQKGVGRALGPLEIPRSTRYGILAGLWIATFLSVSFCLFRVISNTTSLTSLGSESYCFCLL